jgi:hypothetical protein
MYKSGHSESACLQSGIRFCYYWGQLRARPFATSRDIFNGDYRARAFPQPHALVSNEAEHCFSQ